MASKTDLSRVKQVANNQGAGESGTDLLTDKTGPENRSRRQGKGAKDKSSVRERPKKKKDAGEGD